jgi:hypothetical protein
MNVSALTWSGPDADVAESTGSERDVTNELRVMEDKPLFWHGIVETDKPTLARRPLGSGCESHTVTPL